MSNFIATLQSDLSLFATEPGWTPQALTEEDFKAMFEWVVED